MRYITPISIFLLALAFTPFPTVSRAENPGEFLNRFHAKLADLVTSDRERVRQYIAGSVDTCIPDSALAYWSKESVKKAGIEAYVTAYGLMTPDRSKKQRSREFADWALKEYSRLPEADRQDFSRLMKSGFYGAQTTFCLSKALFGRI